jgi:hypothetical protein
MPARGEPECLELQPHTPVALTAGEWEEYVIERFAPEEIVVLNRDDTGALSSCAIDLGGHIKPKMPGYQHPDVAGLTIFDAGCDKDVPTYGPVFAALGKIVFGTHDTMKTVYTDGQNKKAECATPSPLSGRILSPVYFAAGTSEVYFRADLPVSGAAKVRRYAPGESPTDERKCLRSRVALANPAALAIWSTVRSVDSSRRRV